MSKLARFSHTAAAAAFLALLGWTIHDQVRWELYRLEHRCIEVSRVDQPHYPVQVTYRCADGLEVVR
jgi:hypothetical protein